MVAPARRAKGDKGYGRPGGREATKVRQTALITRRGAQDNSLEGEEEVDARASEGCHIIPEIPTMLTMSFVFPKRRKEFSI